LATILSCAMMLRWSFGLAAEADAIEAAIEGALNAGLRCGDVRSPGATVVGTVEMGDAVIARV
jgi:3-isopropylmalate dehydrogenase